MELGRPKIFKSSPETKTKPAKKPQEKIKTNDSNLFRKFPFQDRESNFHKFYKTHVLPFYESGKKSTIPVSNSINIVVAQFEASTMTHGLVLVLPGRTESTLKYAETIFDLAQLGFDVICLDHRGQGESSRSLPDPSIGHVASFANYADDTSKVWQQVIVDYQRQKSNDVPIFILAHSMGGLIALDFITRYRPNISGLILCSPMIRFRTPGIPGPIANTFSKIMCLLEKGTEAVSKETKPDLNTYGLDLTWSKARRECFISNLRQNQKLQPGVPSYQWIRESLKAQNLISKQLKSSPVNVPVLVLEAQNDQVVWQGEIKHLFRFFSSVKHITFGQAQHELLQERDFIRNPMFEAISSFLRRVTLSKPFLQVPIAHRGLYENSKQIPENSIRSFQEALERGFGIELDIRLSKDKKVVVFHDDNLQRMCGDSAELSALTYDKIAAHGLLDTNEKSPLLLDVLRLLESFENETTLPLIIELKTFGDAGMDSTSDSDELIAQTLACLKNYTGPVALKSFNPLTVARLLQEETRPYLIGALACDFTKDIDFKKMSLEESLSLKNLTHAVCQSSDFISYNINDLTDGLAKLTKQRQQFLFSWTIRTEAQAKKALRLCNNIIFEWRGIQRDSLRRS